MWEYKLINSGEDLQHHGVKGMKWGVRQYQNEDGSYTSAGKARYAKKAVTQMRNLSQQIQQIDAAHRKTMEGAAKKKSINDMTDDELLKDNRRRALENQYKKNHQALKLQVQSAKEAVDQTQKAVTQMRDLSRQMEAARRRTTPIDLSKYSDDELRKAINRKNLERQYQELFKDPESISSGQAKVDSVLSYAGTGLALTSTALGIAVAVKQLSDAAR